MDEVKIQQQMTNFISEFSGDETDENQTSNSLAKFIGTADMVYNRLRTNEEKAYFNDIIKFKLTGTAFTRVNRLQIADFGTLKTTLCSMYRKTLSLNELERRFNDIKQQYGEPIRKYGYRLSEALEQYKSAYKQKYQLDNLDNSHKRHLDINSVDIFKRGLTNIILKEKIITIRTENLEEIITETETIEKMLLDATNDQTYQYPHTKPLHKPDQSIAIPNLVICNYCQKPNHTYNVCRTRLYDEARTHAQQRYIPRSNYNQPNFQFNQQRTYDKTRFQNRYTPPQNQTNFINNQPQTNPTNRINQNLTHPTINSNQQPSNRRNFTNYRNMQEYAQPQYQQNRPQRKYCSHCKTTTGHTFEECRSKFLTSLSQPPARQQTHQKYQNNNQTMNNLENDFTNMRINLINPYHREHFTENPHETPYPQGQQYNQGNDNGSTQL